ncbi:LysR family transcriptional regulator [Streptomyces sp. NPDC051018]|uniref:LysR family transcriptional regulator n=1 Tax=Streptomyces sp. NPDC051018 TaxID=3365639 RepID=UPI0037BB7EC2
MNGRDAAGARSAGQRALGRAEPSITQLRQFLVLADELHFGRAAQRLFLTQPALSRQIKALEDRLGVDLLHRTTRHVELTDVGREIVPEARALVAAVERFQACLATLTRQIKGRLRLGAIGAEAAMPYTVDVLEELSARQPGITVEIRSVDFVEQISALTRGEIDAAFLRPPLPPGFRSLRLATEPRVVCLHADDPLVGRAPLTLAQLSDRTVIDVLPEAPRAWWDFWTANPHPGGAPVRYGPQVSDLEGMLHAVASGAGITFLPAAARSLYPRPGVAYVDVTGLPPTTAALVWLPSHPTPPALRALLTAARTVVRRRQARDGGPPAGSAG